MQRIGSSVAAFDRPIEMLAANNQVRLMRLDLDNQSGSRRVKRLAYRSVRDIAYGPAHS